MGQESRSRWRLAVIAAFGLLGCGSDPPHAAKPHDDAGPGACAAGELPVDGGGCEPAGVPPERCGEGFVADEVRGCVAVLPDSPCVPGTFALPGESSCHEVAPCGDAPFGDAPPDGPTTYVDTAYAGGNSDGSSARPFVTIQQGIDAAASGGVVAVAEGTYAENVSIAGKPVRLWGRCPAMVEVHGTDPKASAIEIAGGAAGTELRALAITGAGRGVLVIGAEDVSLAGVWVHDANLLGVVADNYEGSTSVDVQGALIESVGALEIFVLGAHVTVADSVLRNALSVPAQGGFGRAVSAQEQLGERATFSVRHSIVEQTAEDGIYAAGGELSLEATLVRDTAQRGIDAEAESTTHTGSTLVVEASVIERAHGVGIYAYGTPVTLDAAVIRDVDPAVDSPGRGVSVEVDPATGIAGELTMTSSLVERATEGGIVLLASNATITGTAVRDTRRGPVRGGMGIVVSATPSGLTASATIQGCSVEHSGELGVFVAGAYADIDALRVIDVQPGLDGLLGDGVLFASLVVPSSGTLRGSRIEQSARVGVSSFGAALTLSGCTLECNQIALDAEAVEGTAATLDDQGQNVCGCAGAVETCRTLTTGLEPPTPIEP